MTAAEGAKRRLHHETDRHVMAAACHLRVRHYGSRSLTPPAVAVQSLRYAGDWAPADPAVAPTPVSYTHLTLPTTPYV